MIFKRTTTYEKQLIEEKEKLRNIDYWTSYLKTASMQYKHSFDIQTAIHAANPKATACAGADFWNSKDCNINPDAKPIYVSVNGRTQKLFDVSDVTGQFKTSYWIWSMQDKAFDLDFTETVNSRLTSSYSITSDTLEETLYDIALRKTAEKYSEKSEYSHVISESAAFVAIHRCCPDMAEMTPESLNGLSSFDIDEIGQGVTAVAREILNEVEKIVKQERIEIIKRSIADEHEQDREQEVPKNSDNKRSDNGVGREVTTVPQNQRQVDTTNRGRNTEFSPQSQNVETGRDTLLENRSPVATDRPNIIGNTEFKYIPQKSYRKFNNSVAEKMIPLIDESGIKYSGKVTDSETTFTVSRSDVEKLMKFAEQAKENEVLETEEMIEDDPPDTAEYSKEKFTKNPDTWSITWDYYNPEGNNGNGQFVSIQIYDDDIEGAMNYANGDVDSFIEYINSNCKTELIDRGTEEFEEFEKHFIEDNYDLVIDSNSGNSEVYSFLSYYLKELQKDIPENPKLFTLSEVITEFYSNDNVAVESEGGTWKIQPIENDNAELLHNGKAECSISFESGTMTVKPYSELSVVPAMVKGTLEECMPNFKVVLEEYERVFESSLDKAKYLIDTFCESEYGNKGDYDDLHNIGIAYTTLTDEELPVQVTADLVDFKIIYEFNSEVYDVEQYDSLESMIENNLKWLDFDTLVSVPEDVIEKHTKANESTLHFGMLGNGATVYDTSRTDKETNDYPTVAHISDEGVVNIYDNTLLESDMQLINNEAQKSREDFYAEWNNLLTFDKYQRLLSNADEITKVNILNDTIPFEEKIEKYMPYVFFKEGERPEPEKSEKVQEQTEDAELKEMFMNGDIATLIVKEALSSDEWEDLACPLFENGYIDKHKPSEKAILGEGGLSEVKLYELANRFRNGEDIREELAYGLVKGEFVRSANGFNVVLSDGKLVKESVFTPKGLEKHMLRTEYGDDGHVRCTLDNNYERVLTYKEIGQIFIDRIREEWNDLAYWAVLDYIKDDIPDISDETVKELITAFDNSIMHDWENNTVVINRIKKSLHNIFDDEDKTEKAFACIAKHKYNVVIENIQAELQSEMKYQIYQLPMGDKYHGIRFESMDTLKKSGIRLNHADYEFVYEGMLDEFNGTATLESIFTKFNTDHPDDFKGHSLSMSDVIVIKIGDEKTAYYCDDIGFTEMPDFFKEKEIVTEKFTYDVAVDEIPMTETFANEESESVKSIDDMQGSLFDNIDDTAEKAETPNISENAGISIGDKFKRKIDGAVVEVVSLSGALPWYQDDVTVKRIEGSFEITENISADKLLDENRYERVPNIPQVDIVNLRKVGNFYEVYGDEAIAVSNTLGLNLTVKNGLEMVGFPDNKKSEYSDRLRDAGYTVLIEEVYELNPSRHEDMDNAVEDVSEEIKRDTPENFSITVDEYDLGGAKSKFKANVEAIKMLKQLIAEDRKYANPEEQAIIAKYTGWGGLANAFDENRSDWSDEYAELKSLLTEEEYVSARSTVTDAFYTPPFIIHSIYKALDNFGFMSGKILDPSTGIGNFIGSMPVEMKTRSSITATEVDKISGRIAQYLYPLTNVEITGFEKKNLADNSFDVVVGNIPFGSLKINDRRYNKHNFAIHDYFFAKSLDKVRAGGIVAFITSTSTMDKQNSSVRKYISDRAELLGAIRLPNNAFKSYAGTEVSADIIFLKKRERMIDIAEDWVYTSEYQIGDEIYPMNNYFLDNPDMVLGNVVLNKLYGRGTSVEAYENSDLKEQLEKAISKIKGKYIERTDEIVEEDELENAIPAEEGVRNFSYTIADDKIYYRQGNSMLLQDFTGKKAERVQGMIAISACVHELLDMQLQGYPEMSLSAKRQELNELYEDFTKKHGLLNSRENVSVFSEDVSAPLLLSLENVNDGKLIGKADIFTKTTLKPPEKVTSVTNAHDALIVSISEKARVDLDFMSELLDGMDKEQIVEELKGDIYYSPENEEYQTADEYLSGNIRNKLRVAKAFLAENPEMADNISALENAIPEPLQAADIVVKLGASWVDTKYIEQFIYEKFEIPITSAKEIKVGHNNYSANWNIENKSYLSAVSRIVCTDKFGTKRKNALEILEASLNQRDISVYDLVYNSEKGKDERVINHDQTLLARQKQDAIEREFTEWIFADADRRNDLVDKYNVLFNSVRNRQYDGSHLNFEGMNTNITLRKHQRDAIAHALYGGNTLFAHKVGAGKSFEMIATAMEGKRLGLHNKTLIAVPNHMTVQFANDFLQLYPNANILVADKKDFAKNNRRKLCAKIATGDFDAVIIGHSQLVKIPISREREQQYLQDQIDEILGCIIEEKQRDGKSFAIKDMERTRKNLEEKLEKLVESPVKDNTVTFEELGIDRLIIDEADLFKNLPVITKMHNISGIATNTNVQKTQDLYLKCHYINEITGGKGLTFATGTPISNSVTEAYIMNKYLDPYGLAEKDMRSFDAWAANFAQRVTKLEFAPTGKGFRQKTRISKFNNLPELMQMFKKFTDIKMAEDLKLPEPECERHIIKAERSDIQAQLMESLSERAEKIHNKMVTPDEDNMLLITSDGTKIGLDPRLINPMLPDFEGSKVNLCVNNVLDIYNSTSADKLTQVVFCDYSTPKYSKTEGFSSVYEDIKQKLISKGVPENEIAFIHDCKNDKQKQQLFDKVKSGDVRVIIGSTQKMGAGTNFQDRLYALHHLDCPWKPRDLEQRLGRMKRQGNMNEKVHEYIYVTQDTFDAYRFQTVENKQGYISQIMSNSSPLRSCEDVSSEEMGYAAVKAACVGNPLIKEKMELDIAVNELQVLKKGFNNSRYKLEDDVNIHLPKKITSAKRDYENSLHDIETAKRFPKRTDSEGKQFFYGITLNGKLYKDKEQAGKELNNAVAKAIVGNMKKHINIGEYKGFQLEAYFDVMLKKTKIDICGQNKYTIEVGESADGNIQRLDNKINVIPEISEDFKVEFENAAKQLEDAKAQLDIPFEHEQELQEKLARLDFLNAELSKENEDKLLGKDNDKSFEIATEAEKKEAEEREKQRVQKELDGDFDLSEM